MSAPPPASAPAPAPAPAANGDGNGGSDSSKPAVTATNTNSSKPTPGGSGSASTKWSAAEKKQRWEEAQKKTNGSAAPPVVYPPPEPTNNKLSSELMSDIKANISARYINVTHHPSLPFSIYNYNQKCQFDRVWNGATMACRGLILDDLGGIVARPFLKFFNFGEGGAGIPVVPLAVQQASGGGGKGGSGGSGGGGGEFIAYDKLDGSLGITYFYGGKAYIATRGSFVSEQAQVATRMLNELYPDAVESMVKWAGKYTFLFEIIYPENRIVVDYGTARKLVLIGIIDNATGHDVPILSPESAAPYLGGIATTTPAATPATSGGSGGGGGGGGGSSGGDGKTAVPVPVPAAPPSRSKKIPEVVKTYDGLREFSKIQSIQESNREGFVIRFLPTPENMKLGLPSSSSGLRVKIKFEQYKKMHHAKSSVSSTTIWSVLSTGGSMTDLLELLPDEQFQWVRNVEADLKKRVVEVEQWAQTELNRIRDQLKLTERKQIAAYIMKTYPVARGGGAGGGGGDKKKNQKAKNTGDTTAAAASDAKSDAKTAAPATTTTTTAGSGGAGTASSASPPSKIPVLAPGVTVSHILFTMLDAAAKKDTKSAAAVQQLLWRAVEPERVAPAGVDRDPNAD